MEKADQPLVQGVIVCIEQNPYVQQNRGGEIAETGCDQLKAMNVLGTTALQRHHLQNTSVNVLFYLDFLLVSNVVFLLTWKYIMQLYRRCCLATGMNEPSCVPEWKVMKAAP